jgi:hypothetical protein
LQLQEQISEYCSPGIGEDLLKGFSSNGVKNQGQNYKSKGYNGNCMQKYEGRCTKVERNFL